VRGRHTIDRVPETDKVPIATATDVERVFSQGRIILSHIRNGLSAQSVRALICLGGWSLAGLVRDEDIYATTKQAADETEEQELPDGWDSVRDVVPV
jgi:hypothetical protein